MSATTVRQATLARIFKRESRISSTSRCTAARWCGPAPGPEVFLHRQVLRREGLVHLEEIEVLQRRVVPLESLADGGRGTDTHDRRIAAADSPAEELAERLEPALVGELPGGDDQRSGAVADSARGTRVDDAVLLEHLGQLGERFDGGVRAVVLVAAEVDRLALLARELDGGELVGEASRFLGRGEAPLRENAVLVHLALRDAVLGSEVLRGHRHGKAVVTVGQPLPERVLELGRLAETDAETQPTGDVRGLGHALGPAHERALR